MTKYTLLLRYLLDICAGHILPYSFIKIINNKIILQFNFYKIKIKINDNVKKVWI